MGNQLRDRVVVVTGASAGVGRATAVEFGRRGATVALLARGVDGLEGARREVEQAGGRALVVPTDVAHWEQVDAAAERIEAELGPIDIWVNAAMATIFCPVTSTDPADFRRATEVTYLGSVHGILAALQRMHQRDRGTIVQVGSALAYRGIPLQAPYCGAKFAIRGFLDSLHSELLHDGSAIRLSMVQLAAFNTPQFDWGRTCMNRQPQPVPPIFQPEVAARAIVGAALRPRRELWVGFPAVKGILAARWLPARWLDRYLAKQGYTGQLTDEPLDPQRPDNLYQPAAGDFGAHGRFDARAKPRSMQSWATLHRRPVSMAGTAALLLLIALGERLL